jgi:FkbM family methyltransferase
MAKANISNLTTYLHWASNHPSNFIFFLIRGFYMLWTILLAKLIGQGRYATYFHSDLSGWEPLVTKIMKGTRFKCIKINDTWLFLSGPIRLDLILGIAEGQVIKVLCDKLRYEDVFIDVGSHIGYYTLLASRKARSVISIESHPGNFSYLIHNIRINHCKNVIPLQLAVSNQKGQVKLYLRPCSLTHSIIKPKDLKSRSKSITVPATTLDNLIKSLGLQHSNFFIKIDVEGAELEVLKGARKTLKSTHTLIIEVHTSTEVIRKLLAKRFKCSLLSEFHLLAESKCHPSRY